VAYTVTMDTGPVRCVVYLRIPQLLQVLLSTEECNARLPDCIPARIVLQSTFVIRLHLILSSNGVKVDHHQRSDTM